MLRLFCWVGVLMNISSFVSVAVLCATLASPALAQDAQVEVPLGLWKSEPDRRGIVLNVRTKPCGRSMCGRVERVKDRRGYDTPSTMVGQKVLWDLKPQPDGSFLGKMVDNQGNWLSETRIEARSGKLHLRACGDDGCQDLVWKRLR
ncbi:hypothetical protein PM02_17220 [Sulfitobacter mediterraneus]|uniref:DUF2147 domain-containing protein n=2 Tax=Sulfitobacter mediterraneus TaxID=83219 RepID=A0A061SQF0_9RHOB|nr:hypothetical protein PM02_17220 [Sulfitobacter mediterraneus]